MFRKVRSGRVAKALRAGLLLIVGVVLFGASAVVKADDTQYVLSGNITDDTSVPVAAVDVLITPENGGPTTTVRGDASGNYSATVDPGEYHVVLSSLHSNTVSKRFSYFKIDKGVVDLTTANAVRDYQLPAPRNLDVTFNGHANVQLDVTVGEEESNSYQNWGGGTSNSSNPVNPISLKVLDGEVVPVGSLCITYLATNAPDECNTTEIIIGAGPNEYTFTAPLMNTFSGQVFTATGAVTNSSQGIRLHAGGKSITPSGKTNVFSFRLLPGSYDVTMSGNSFPAFPIFEIPVGSIDATNGNVTQNYQFPETVPVTITVLDADGNPVPNTDAHMGTPEQHVTPLGTDANGKVVFNALKGYTVGPGGFCANHLNICSTESYVLSGPTSVTLQVPAPDTIEAPENLQASSPTTQPALMWSPVEDADTYKVYRDGEYVGTTILPGFTDTAAADGTHQYYVTAVKANGTESSPSVPIVVVVDTTAPVVGSFTIANKPADQAANFTAPATDDDGTGVVGGEYYYGTDPGEGNGVAMTYNNGMLTGVLPNTMPAGTYTIYVRAWDQVGNTSVLQSTTLVVTTAINNTATGQYSYLRPSAGDTLPGGTPGLFDYANYNFNVHAGAGSTFTFGYAGGGLFCWLLPGINGCHHLTLTATSFTSLQFSGSNNQFGVFDGVATVTVDGVTTTNNFRLEITDGNRASNSTQDSFKVKIYAPGQPVGGTVLYQASGTVGRGNTAVRIQ